MNIRKTLIIALAVCAMVSSAALYTAANTPDIDKTNMTEIALDFLFNGPTFSFDGIPASVEVTETYSMESYPVQHVVVIAFQTRNAGCGDRAGTFIAPVITPHVIRVTIVEGEVVSAVIDDNWDELNQEQIIHEEMLLPERARDTVIEFLLGENPELGDHEVPESWVSEVHTANGLVGASTMKYMGGDWSVSLSYPIVQFPDFDVVVEYTGEPGFTWSGSVSSNGEVSETAHVMDA